MQYSETRLFWLTLVSLIAAQHIQVANVWKSLDTMEVGRAMSLGHK